MRWALLCTLGVAGCLPAYDNHAPPPIIRPDVDGGDCASGGVKVTVKPSALEEGLDGTNGPIVAVDGCSTLGSGPTGASGSAVFSVPKALSDSQSPYYLLLTGTFKQQPIVPTLLAPKVWIPPNEVNHLAHFLEGTVPTAVPDAMNGIRGAAVASLVDQGVTTEGNPDNLAFGYGRLIVPSGSGDLSVYNYAIQVDGQTTGPDCKTSDTQCCLFYARNFSEYVGSADAGKKKFVDRMRASATAPYTFFTLVCGAGAPTEHTLHQTSQGLIDSDTFPVAATFGDIAVVVRAKTATFIEWRSN